MSTETNKAIIRRYHEQVWNERRRELFEEFVTENVVPHGTPGGPGLEGIKQGYDMAVNAFPDAQQTIEDVIAEGDKVVVRWMSRATHQGELLGIPGTGQQVTLSGVTIYRLDDARIVEMWYHPDNLSLMQQLGVIPAPDAA